jgi:hypothetical protein
MHSPTFHESLGATPIRALGLSIAGTTLEPLIAELEREMSAAGLHHLHCRFYLSTEWGVPFGTIAIALPFYLARAELTELHAQRYGHVEGLSGPDILRYLRHELGHAVNYGYRLFEDPRWIDAFGAITQPYLDEYRPELFSRRHVRHLPGWYAQKHPDEDWAETFAVWLTTHAPESQRLDWRAEYADWPDALGKLELCEVLMREHGDRPPLVTDAELDVDVSELTCSLDEFYGEILFDPEEMPAGLDGALRAIFEDLGEREDDSTALRLPASELVHKIERRLIDDVFRWTGHFPERTRPLLHHLAVRCDALLQVYPADRELPAVIALTTLVTALAVQFIYRGRYQA